MRFWCSNDGTNWTWAWRPYIGAWVIAAALAAMLWRAGTWRSEVPIRRRIAAALGLMLLLVGTDWPLSALGAGYIVSAQMVRQVLIVMIAAPLLLFGAPAALGEWLDATERRRRVVRTVTNPLVALLSSVVLLITVSVPVVVDPLITSQIGSFALDIAWIGAGFLIWMPVQPPTPLVPRLSGPPAIIYLILVSVAPLPVAFFMTWSEYPIYPAYELAPRVFDGFDAKADQELAAAIFQVAGGLVIWAQIVVRFIRMAGGSSGPKFRGTLVPRSMAWIAIAGIVLVSVGCTGGDDNGVALSPQGKQGKAVADNNACAACHSTNGDAMTGPTWKGLYGSKVTLANGSTATVDAEYVERALREPNTDRREGIVTQMPTFDEDRITDEQLADIVAYLKDLAE